MRLTIIVAIAAGISGCGSVVLHAKNSINPVMFGRVSHLGQDKDEAERTSFLTPEVRYYHRFVVYSTNKGTRSSSRTFAATPNTLGFLAAERANGDVFTRFDVGQMTCRANRGFHFIYIRTDVSCRLGISANTYPGVKPSPPQAPPSEASPPTEAGTEAPADAAQEPQSDTSGAEPNGEGH